MPKYILFARVTYVMVANVEATNPAAALRAEDLEWDFVHGNDETVSPVEAYRAIDMETNGAWEISQGHVVQVRDPEPELSVMSCSSAVDMTTMGDNEQEP